MSIPLSISKSGMNAVQNAMDALSHDIANSNTTGYKSKNVSFSELMVNDLNGESVLLSERVQNPGINNGTKSGVNTTNMAQGALIADENAYHLAIAGDGFFWSNGSKQPILFDTRWSISSKWRQVDHQQQWRPLVDRSCDTC